MKIYTCPHCGSDQLTFSGIMTWSVVKQDFVIGETFLDDVFCVDCEAEFSVTRPEVSH